MIDAYQLKLIIIIIIIIVLIIIIIIIIIITYGPNQRQGHQIPSRTRTPSQNHKR